MGKGTILAIWVVGDTGALGVITASLLGLLPPIAAVFAIGWYALQMWESKSCQNLMRNRRLKKLVYLRAAAAALELIIRQKNTDLSGLVAANTIHAAAFSASRDVTQKQDDYDHRVLESDTDRLAAADVAAALLIKTATVTANELVNTDHPKS